MFSTPHISISSCTSSAAGHYESRTCRFCRKHINAKNLAAHSRTRAASGQQHAGLPNAGVIPEETQNPVATLLSHIIFYIPFDAWRKACAAEVLTDAHLLALQSAQPISRSPCVWHAAKHPILCMSACTLLYLESAPPPPTACADTSLPLSDFVREPHPCYILCRHCGCCLA